MSRTRATKRSGRCTRASGVPLRPDHVAPQAEQLHRCAPVRVRPHRMRSSPPQRGQEVAGPHASARASISRTASARFRASATISSAWRSSCGDRRASWRPNSAGSKRGMAGLLGMPETRTLPYWHRRTKVEPTRFADTAAESHTYVPLAKITVLERTYIAPESRVAPCPVPRPEYRRVGTNVWSDRPKVTPLGQCENPSRQGTLRQDHQEIALTLLTSARCKGYRYI